MKVLELFGGIGACTQALKRLGIDFEIADYVEIDKYAVKSYNAMNGTNFEPQDITKWDKDIDVDLIMHGSPCQDFSLAGKQAGGDEGSGTRSSLMYETVRIVEKLRPKYVVWENVKNVLSKKHRHNFDAYLEKMESLGYVNYYQVLNAKDYGIPQNRERVFCVSILSGGQFEFPPKQELELRLKDMLESEVDEKYFLTKALNMRFTENYIQYDNSGKGYNSQAARLYYQDGLCPAQPARNAGDKTQIVLMDKVDCLKIKTNNKKGYDEATIGDTINLEQPNSKTRRGRVGHGVAQTLNTSCNQAAVVELKRGYSVEVKPEQETTDEIDLIGNYSKSNYNATPIVGKNGVSPTVRENHGKVTAITEPQAYISEKGVKFICDSKRGMCTDVNPEIAQPLTARGQQNWTGSFISPNIEYLEKSSTIGSKEPTKIHLKNGETITQNDDLSGLRIRKLTPKECWRLMGFTDEVFEKAEKVNSNTQLYKQAGNSIVVDVLVKIFTNLFMEEEEVKKISEKKIVTIETDKMIDLVALQEKEPELFEELAADYPCEEARYIFDVKTE